MNSSYCLNMSLCNNHETMIQTYLSITYFWMHVPKALVHYKKSKFAEKMGEGGGANKDLSLLLSLNETIPRVERLPSLGGRLEQFYWKREGEGWLLRRHHLSADSTSDMTCRSPHLLPNWGLKPAQYKDGFRPPQIPSGLD